MFIKDLFEKFSPFTYSPSKYETLILSIIVTAKDPVVADSLTSKGEHINISKNKLFDIGVIEKKNNGIQLTSEGLKLAISQALSDPLGRPTDRAFKIAS
jgi:hypothetical protein